MIVLAGPDEQRMGIGNRETNEMMNKRIPLFCGLVLLALACGCATTPPADGTASSTYSVGDRASVVFDEVIVSLPYRGAEAPYQNLHLVLAALVNVRKKTYASSSGLEQILSRLETRVAAQVSEVLSNPGAQLPFEMPQLRAKILTEAQAVVDDALRQWEHGSEYRVEMVIANLYWTDASVGRTPPQRRGWW